jgi:hypothetical protein
MNLPSQRNTIHCGVSVYAVTSVGSLCCTRTYPKVPYVWLALRWKSFPSSSQQTEFTLRNKTQALKVLQVPNRTWRKCTTARVIIPFVIYFISLCMWNFSLPSIKRLYLYQKSVRRRHQCICLVWWRNNLSETCDKVPRETKVWIVGFEVLTAVNTTLAYFLGCSAL